MAIVAWAYMVETDTGLSKKKVGELLTMIPDDVEVLPFSTDITVNGQSLLEANSIAYGFLDNDHYDDMLQIQKTLAGVCNDWTKLRQDSIYTADNGLQIVLIHNP